MFGEVQKQNCFIIDTSILDPDPVAPTNPNPFIRCCYTQDVYADSSDADNYKNDHSPFIDILPISVSAVTMRLQKFVNGAWVNQTTLTDNTYGTFYAYGFKSVNNLKYVGYWLSWRAVLLVFGIGKYRVQFDITSQQRNSPEFCLKNYSIEATDETVRIEWINNSIIGDRNQARSRDFVGVNWRSQIRLKHAIFGMKNGSYEVERQRWQTGYERTHKKTFSEKYLLEVRELPIEIQDLLCYDMSMADDIYITDYNSRNNSGKYVEQSVEISGEFAPDYSNNNPRPSLILGFVDRFSNRQKYYS